MAEEFQFSFTIKQIEGVLTALERCGVIGPYSSALEYFNRDPELLNAAKSAHAVLRKTGQRHAKAVSKPEVVRELQKETLIPELRERYRALKADYKDLLSETSTLLSAAVGVRDRLPHDPLKNNEERAALETLRRVLDELGFKESDLAAKLYALERVTDP